MVEHVHPGVDEVRRWRNFASRAAVRIERTCEEILVTQGVTLQRVQTSLGTVELYHFDNHRHAFPRHAHDVFTLGVFGEGNGTIRVRSGAHGAVSGAVLALAPDEAHSAEPLATTGWSYRSLCPSPEIAALVTADQEGFAFDRPVIHDVALAHELSLVYRALERGSEPLATEERLLGLLRHAVVRHGTRRTGIVPAARSAAVARARALLDARFAEPVHLAELSSVCGMSPFQLIRAFHATVGVPPHVYLTQMRAERARELLRRGEPISGVAFACGFADQSHLTRVFKRHFGLTPGAYQRA
jgi:AraC-like DNA-binding protein